MSKQQYVCLGACQALISEDQYLDGLRVCGNDTCNLKGKPFIKGNKCKVCGKTYSKNKSHTD